MKKLLALLLVMVTLLGMLAGCSKKDEKTDDKNDSGNNAANQQTEAGGETTAPTQPKPEQVFGVAVGTELDAPEKVFAAEEVKDFYISFDRKEEGKVVTTEYSVIKKEDGTKMIYAVNGPGKSKEAIYVLSDTLTKFIKGSAKDPFKLDDKTTAEDVKKEFDAIYDHLMVFTQYQDTFTGIKYRKTTDVSVTLFTGDVYIYDVIADGKVAGQVCIDKATGLLVKAKDLTNTQSVVVNAFKTADIEIPEIATGEDTPAEGETPEGETPEGETDKAPETDNTDTQTPAA